MKWKIKFSSQAEKYYLKLPKNVRRRVKEKTKNLRNTEHPLLHPEVKALIGKLEGFYRLKVGKFRIIFGILEKEKIIAVVNIYPRGKAYK